MPISFSAPQIASNEAANPSLNVTVDIGEPSSDRIVLVGVTHAPLEGNGAVLSSAVLGGVPGTVLESDIFTTIFDDQFVAEIVAFEMPTMASNQTLTLTMTATTFNVVTSAWVVRNAVLPEASSGVSNDAALIDLIAEAGQAIFVAVHQGDTASQTVEVADVAQTTYSQNGFYFGAGHFAAQTDLAAGSADVTLVSGVQMTAASAVLLAPGAAGPSEITGTLTVQETGSDSASVAADVVVSGAVAAQETGADVAAASVAVGVAAAVAGQEAGSDLATATGAVGLEVALGAQESGADSTSASVAVGIAGVLAAQEAGADTASASASVDIGITISGQEIGADLASSGVEIMVATGLAGQELGSDGVSVSASIALSGALAALEAGGDVAAVSVAVPVAGALVAQESGADRAVIQAGSGRIVTLSTLEAGSDQAAGSAAVGIDAGLGAQELGGDIASVIISIEDNVITVNLAARETGPDVGSGAAAVGVAAAALAREQGADGAVILGNVVILASAALSENGTDRATIVVQNSVPIPSARRAAKPAQSANGGRLTVTANGGRLIQSRNGGRLV